VNASTLTIVGKDKSDLGYYFTAKCFGYVEGIVE